MQCVVADWKASAGHVPDVPVHISATSHWPAEARLLSVAVFRSSTQTLLVPVQWSAGSSSHTPPCDVPMQCVVADWKASAGHVPDVPVHVSATSHCPAEARHVTLAALYASTHVLLLPVQSSAVSSSHTPLCDAPMQCVPPASAPPHCPTAARHVSLAACTASTHVFPLPLQGALPSSSHTPPCDAPMQCVLPDGKASAGHVPEVPVQVSATSHCPAEARHV